jgi:hypothetical protein
MAQSKEQIAYAAYVKKATDEHQEVLPFGRWQTWKNLPEALQQRNRNLAEVRARYGRPAYKTDGITPFEP